MSGTPTETQFEQFFTDYLVNRNGYRQVDSSAYDKDLCVIHSELETFLRESQPDEWAKFVQNSGGVDSARRSLYARLKTELSKGTLSAIRDKKTFEAGNGSVFKLLYFKPQSDMADEHIHGYRSNRFAVVRQLHYTKNRHKFMSDLVIDMAIFINGLPIATLELKNALTGQNHLNAIRQYMQDRPVEGEPLLSFGRCLVHFAMGTEQVFMTTRLAGQGTRFFPFNKSYMNEREDTPGYKTAYMWEEVLTKDSLLDLIENFIMRQSAKPVFDDKASSAKVKVYTPDDAIIFPRWHQLRAVRRLVADTQEMGTGHRYLIQHSAGSGKSNTITWLTYRLASLFPKGKRTGMFNSVIVVTDRLALDNQLSNNIRQFSQTIGQVVHVKSGAELKQAIEDGQKVIVSTLQKFSVIADTIDLFPDRHYAVIIDEAHSSQTGEAARNMRKALSLKEAEKFDEQADNENDFEQSVIDCLEADTRRKGAKSNVNFYAFTATPKPKTIELFSERSNGMKGPFDSYSMEDAIREGFIIDVLQNYTSFSRYYKLVQRAGVTDKQYQERKAVRLLSNYVDLQDTAIERKARIMLEHFASQTAQQLQGKARAMVVTRSRLHAVRYKRKFDEIMQEMHLPYGCLVAFSGTVHDAETNEDYSESTMNGDLHGSIPLAFRDPKYRILIVANKFQTGFDEPLLHTMFVDKKLQGLNAVQTLSRLNRTMKGKTDTMILDFVNDPEEIQQAFQDYYCQNLMREEDETDPNALYDIKSRVDDFGVFTEDDVQAFLEYFYNPNGDPQLVYGPLNRVCQKAKGQLESEQLNQFKKTCSQFVKLYRFLSQIIPFADANLEKYYYFLTALVKMLPYNIDTLPIDVLKEAELDSYKLQYNFCKALPLESSDNMMQGMRPAATNSTQTDEEEWLSKIIQTLNDTFGLNLSEEDKVELQRLQAKVQNNEELLGYFNPNNSRDDVRDKFYDTIDAEFLEFINTKLELYNKLTDDRVGQMLKAAWFNELYDRRVRGIHA